MAWSIVQKGGPGKIPTWRKFICDTIDDIATLPVIPSYPAGCECYCSEDGNVYVLETDGDWVVKSTGGGGSGSDLVSTATFTLINDTGIGSGEIGAYVGGACLGYFDGEYGGISVQPIPLWDNKDWIMVLGKIDGGDDYPSMWSSCAFVDEDADRYPLKTVEFTTSGNILVEYESGNVLEPGVGSFEFGLYGDATLTITNITRYTSEELAQG